MTHDRKSYTIFYSMKISFSRIILSLTLCLPLTDFAVAQTPAPASKASAAKPAEEPEPPPRIGELIVRYDVISLPALAARKALLQHPVEQELYEWLDADVDKKDSGVAVEYLEVMRIRSGQRSKVESIDEHAYPTEFDPPTIPQNFGGGGSSLFGNGGGSSFPSNPTTPTAYTFRNLGFTGEMELTLGEDRRTVDINLAIEISRLAALVPQGLRQDVTQPVFETQKLTQQMLTIVDRPTLASTMSPATSTDTPGGNKPDRVWLMFVTVSFPR